MKTDEITCIKCGAPAAFPSVVKSPYMCLTCQEYNTSNDDIKTSCCGYIPAKGLAYPVMWNEFNKVVQCHNCGQVWKPQSDALATAREELEKTTEALRGVVEMLLVNKFIGYHDTKECACAYCKAKAILFKQYDKFTTTTEHLRLMKEAGNELANLLDYPMDDKSHTALTVWNTLTQKDAK